jgi:hypothetical protein
MDGERELIHAGPLPPQVEDTDLGIRNTPEQKIMFPIKKNAENVQSSTTHK